ncbi:MAG: zinc ribbon domain-containing protein [Lachnospiraceae bacterium]|nr:zinc ribbon domain-containing protein [Lachnospiraceae bacterium]
MAICYECGAKISDEEKVCPGCGKELTNTDKKKKKKKQKKEHLKFSDLPRELSVYFFQKTALVIGLIIAIVVIGIITKKVNVILFLSVVVLLYAGYVAYTYYCVVYHKYKIYYGYCIEKRTPTMNIGKKIQVAKGACTLLLRTDEESNARFIVPVGEGFMVNKDDVVLIYSKEQDIYQKDNETYEFINPLLVKVMQK